MDDGRHDLRDMALDQVFSCPRKDSNLRTRFRKPLTGVSSDLLTSCLACSALVLVSLSQLWHHRLPCLGWAIGWATRTPAAEPPVCRAARASAPNSTSRGGALSFTARRCRRGASGPTPASPRTGAAASKEMRRQRTGPTACAFGAQRECAVSGSPASVESHRGAGDPAPLPSLRAPLVGAASAAHRVRHCLRSRILERVLCRDAGVHCAGAARVGPERRPATIGRFASAIEPAFVGARRVAGQGLTTSRQFGAAEARG